MRILIAEDDSVSRLVLHKTLEKLGHTVTAVEDGVQAMLAAEEGQFRLIISDWMMPQMDGLELCTRLRARDDAAYAYMILLTAKDQKEDRAVAMSAGVDDFLVKPMDREELEARLRVAQRILSMQEDLEERQVELEYLHAELKVKNERLTALATTDGLTGLKNHRHFQEALQQACTFADRQQLPVSLIMLDVDYFKKYNDTYGHPAGDEVLKTIAGILIDNARNYDLAARYGGEEFVVLSPGTDAEGAVLLGERIRSAVAAHKWSLREVTVSVGAATRIPQPGDGPQLVSQADIALYHSKRCGRNAVSHFEDLSAAECEAAA